MVLAQFSRLALYTPTKEHVNILRSSGMYYSNRLTLETCISRLYLSIAYIGHEICPQPSETSHTSIIIVLPFLQNTCSTLLDTKQDFQADERSACKKWTNNKHMIAYVSKLSRWAVLKSLGQLDVNRLEFTLSSSQTLKFYNFAGKRLYQHEKKAATGRKRDTYESHASVNEVYNSPLKIQKPFD
ncbi:hypothetical protein RF11_08863 [Thelohanellus kitauei]|uniref:Uncharacterized protein n=1 Tax=Thelohanellus kitauei TaxID=669202 RepID=A0A0C2N1S5_THEKT|nr:hypothetical protein RF11_08863 [Thelohanellus kitauei]